MHIYVTGATGFIGSAITEELRRRGHEVTGLARNERSAEALLKAGAKVHRGNLADPDGLISIAGRVDGIVHTAFDHDFSRYVESCEADGRLLEAMARALRGTSKTLVAASTTSVAAGEPLLTEQEPAHPQVPRSASESFLSFAEEGVRTAVVRLPPTVHGAGDRAFVPSLIALARERGVSAYIGGGANRWPAVHRKDAARLFCDAVEQSLPGARYHGVAEEGIAFRTIAEAIGQGLGVPVESIPPDRAEKHFGWLAMFVALDMPASSEGTRSLTGWAPREGRLLESLHDAGYFAE
ncbi:MAG: SDR family oxidoreductase [Acidobacteriota bacterium]